MIRSSSGVFLLLLQLIGLAVERTLANCETKEKLSKVTLTSLASFT